ncbi:MULTISPECIES: hypothetical protein [unclassified Streptomyces]|uniref:hypothetical protein n=1 Tax=unclassified Streptomyces TaxID=2593676 RepID=UPI000DAE252B|nr:MULTISPECIES: hypothetical protein [unclassified Streptomyces]PZT71916.1 hypothetical protein DNK55_25190 [Streptomyces sp. AC1-42T]PZT81757.1 hypothetical protein DNK56_06370 [Streptomyces sp. AC1-42W]
MRSIPLTFCAAAVAAATVVPVPAALAESGSGHEDSRSRVTLSVTPSSLAPGGEVELELAGCKAKEAKGSSDAFVSEARFSSGGDRTLYAEARVRADAEPGDYDVRAVCKDDKHTTVTATLTVVHRSRPMPVAPVHAGGGGTAVLASDTVEQDGPGTTQEVIGFGLAAVAAAAVAFRGVRRRRPAAD